MTATDFSKTLFSAIEKSAQGLTSYFSNNNVSVLSAPSTNRDVLVTTIGHPVAGGNVMVTVRSQPHNNFTTDFVSLAIFTHARYVEYLNIYNAIGHHDSVYFRSTLDQQLIDLELSNNNGNPVDEDAILDELCGDDCTEEERNELRDSLNEVARCIEELKEMEDTEDES
jgi:hypothetical protein